MSPASRLPGGRGRTARLPLLAVLALLALATAAPAWAAPEALRLPPALWPDGRDYSGELQARVSMRTVKHARVLAQRALELPPKAAAWSGAGVRVLDLGGVGPNLEGFNEARLDYVGQGPDRAGLLGLMAWLARGGDTALFVSDPLETVDRLTPAWVDAPGRDAAPVAKAAWVAKGPRYQLARLLDREPDEDWRVSQDGLSTFVQRRFSKSLLDVGAVDVVLRRGRDVQVNLVAHVEGRGKVVLDWYAIEKRLFDLGDGRQVLRLYVGRHLRGLAPGARRATLKEAALMFFKENKGDVERDRVVEKILFVPSGLPAEALVNGLPRELPARARQVFAGRGELAAGLEPLLDPAWKDWRLSRLAVAQSPQDPDPDPGAPFDQAVESVRLAKVAPRHDVPALTAFSEDLCARFGASCDPGAPYGFVSQEPVSSLDFTALAGPAPSGEAREPRLVHLGAPGLLSATGRLQFQAAPDGLTAACAAVHEPAAITLETGAAFVPEPGRRYGVWLDLGRGRQGLAGVEAEAYGGGDSVRARVNPGMPAWFPSLPARVEGVRLHFSSTGPELAVTLRKAVVQSLDPEARRVGLFQARFLFEGKARPKASRTGPASWSLAAGEATFEPQWLAVDVAAPPWTVQDRPPMLTLASPGASVSMPLPARQARVAVRLPASPRGGPMQYALSLEGGSPGGVLEVSDPVLSGQRLASWPEVLGGIDLADAAGRPARLEGLDGDMAERMTSGAWWMPMGRADLPAGEATVRFPANTWLEVDALLVDKASGPDMAGLARPDQDRPSGRPSRTGMKLVALSGVALALAGLWLACRAGRARRLLQAGASWLDSGDAGTLRLALAAWAAPLAGAALAGPQHGRALAVLSTLAAVPVWRALRPRLARALPVLAKSACVHYCTGFLGATALATLARLLGAAPVSEYLGLAGLWLFFAAIAARLDYGRGSSDSAGSAP